jgi:hypothetical protein
MLGKPNKGGRIAAPTTPTPTLNAKTKPTGIWNDSNRRNLRETGVKFWTERIAIAPIQPATIRDVSKIASVFILTISTLRSFSFSYQGQAYPLPFIVIATNHPLAQIWLNQPTCLQEKWLP